MTTRVSVVLLFLRPSSDLPLRGTTDARALFERIVASFSPERARPIWERWARYEYQFGSFEAAQLLDKRMAEAYPSGMPLADSIALMY